MHDKIIVGYDGSDTARDGLALAKLLAQETGATLLVTHVFRHELLIVPGSTTYDETVRTNAEDMLSDVAATLEDVEVDTRAVGSSSPAWGLQDLAEAEQADLIVLGSSHRGRIGRVLMGTVAERLFHGAPCPVAVAPQGFAGQADPALRVIGVAFDGSPESRAALAAAAGLGDMATATLRIFAVAESGVSFGYTAATGRDQADLLRAQKDYLEGEVAKAIEVLPNALRPLGEVLSGDAAELLASKADEGVDLLITGSRGYGPARRVLLGSVSSKLARSAPCPLLVVPRTAEHSAGPDQSAVTVGDAD